MAKSRRVEVIEIPTEQLSYVPGPHVDRLAVLGRWLEARQIAAPAASAPRVVGDASATFRRLIEVPGGRLAVVLRAWWQQADHDDGHLRLDMPRPVGDAWSISGAFRRMPISRWLPVEVLLSPYHGRWSLLELMPQRPTHPSRVYFREGHRSLDRFVAALCTQDALASNVTMAR
jgi:hypothetical protein